ncbi:SLATT domain-containing protein [Streptomyces hoynatensis]|uniref:SLATT domain-containing protein n=2 Tax=Streptomyces hoynatensis TaxID=1141874 RepID=A0A3A9YU62_9ACTN|nr:SLATT domain-containing protein [Streptomyces hoynatensis]RKN39568.1 SLATT domain-containing protein [Streptomyces hoynatensis]
MADGTHLPPGAWAEPGDRLGELYARAEAEALRSVAWYLSVRRRKRRAARALRLGTVLGAALGVALPLFGLGRPGHLALLGAAACLGCDRYLGVTSGWLRSVDTAQAIRRRLERLRYEWAAELLGPCDGLVGEAAERRLGVLRRFSEDVTELVRAETATWMREFGAPVGAAPPLAAAGQAAPGARPEPQAQEPPARFRFPGDPHLRPSMPRQRPPESGPGGQT